MHTTLLPPFHSWVVLVRLGPLSLPASTPLITATWTLDFGPPWPSRHPACLTRPGPQSRQSMAPDCGLPWPTILTHLHFWASTQKFYAGIVQYNYLSTALHRLIGVHGYGGYSCAESMTWGLWKIDPPSHDHSKLNSFVLWWPQWCSTDPSNCSCRLLHLHPAVTGQPIILLLRQQWVGFHRPGGGPGERIGLPVWLPYIIMDSSGHSGPTRVVVNKRAMPWVSSLLSTESTWGSTCHHGPINPHLHSAHS